MTEEKIIAEIHWPEIATLIFASRGITSGLWRLGIKVRFAALNMQFPEEKNGAVNLVSLPTTLAAVEAIALFPAKSPGPMIFDAAELHSKTKLRTRPATKAKPVARKPVKTAGRVTETQTTSPKAKAKQR